MFFYKFLLKSGKMKKILSSAYSLKLNNIILFFNWGLICIQMVIFATLFRRCPTLGKSTLKMKNVVSTLFNVVEFNVEKHNVVSTLFNVVNFNVDVHNIVSTLIWRCATSRRHINLKTMLNWRWNICWVVIWRNKIRSFSVTVCSWIEYYDLSIIFDTSTNYFSTERKYLKA